MGVGGAVCKPREPKHCCTGGLLAPPLPASPVPSQELLLHVLLSHLHERALPFFVWACLKSHHILSTRGLEQHVPLLPVLCRQWVKGRGCLPEAAGLLSASTVLTGSQDHLGGFVVLFSSFPMDSATRESECEHSLLRIPLCPKSQWHRTPIMQFRPSGSKRQGWVHSGCSSLLIVAVVPSSKLML